MIGSHPRQNETNVDQADQLFFSDYLQREDQTAVKTLEMKTFREDWTTYVGHRGM